MVRLREHLRRVADAHRLFQRPPRDLGHAHRAGPQPAPGAGVVEVGVLVQRRRAHIPRDVPDERVLHGRGRGHGAVRPQPLYVFNATEVPGDESRALQLGRRRLDVRDERGGFPHRQDGREHHTQRGVSGRVRVRQPFVARRPPQFRGHQDLRRYEVHPAVRQLRQAARASNGDAHG